MGCTGAEPFSGRLSPTPLSMLTEAAFWVAHVSVEVPPGAMLCGLAVSVTVVAPPTVMLTGCDVA